MCVWCTLQKPDIHTNTCWINEIKQAGYICEQKIFFKKNYHPQLITRSEKKWTEWIELNRIKLGSQSVIPILFCCFLFSWKRKISFFIMIWLVNKKNPLKLILCVFNDWQFFLKIINSFRFQQSSCLYREFLLLCNLFLVSIFNFHFCLPSQP